MSKPTVGSLFAGIGGFELGFERAGFEVKWQVEINEWCRKVLAKHWPDVRRHDDVTTFPPTDPGEWGVDVIIGGFPCQNISVAGKGAGLAGERSGLWREYARIIRVVRPRYVVVENVAALLYRGLGTVLGDMAESGYDAEWDCIPAAAVGAPHRRDRVFLVAYSVGTGAGFFGGTACGQERPTTDARESAASLRQAHGATGTEGLIARGEDSADVADSVGHGLEGVFQTGPATPATLRSGGSWWASEPDVGRVADGVPSRVDRLRGLGNAVVPQVAEWIARRLLSAINGG